MMNKIQALKILVIGFIFIGEPILFNASIPFSVFFLFLESTWPIQAIIGYGLALFSVDLSSWTIAKRIIAFVIAVPLFCFAGVFLWKISLPEPRYPFPLLAAFGFLLVLIGPIITATEIATSLVARRIIAIVLVLPLCGLFSILSWGGEQIRNTAQLGYDHYYLTTRNAASTLCDLDCGLTTLALYKCDSLGLKCTSIVDWQSDGIPKSNLVVNNNDNELLVFSSGFSHSYGLFYVYGKQPHFVGRSDEFDSKIYYLATQQKLEPYTYKLFKCNQNFMGCKILPFEYITGYQDELFISIDDSGKLTVSNWTFADGDLLIYTYDINYEKPICHVNDCVLKER